MFWGPGLLGSRGRLALLPPLSPWALPPHLPVGRSATCSHPCYRWLGLQFAVGQNSSTGYCRFLRSLHFRLRLPCQARTGLPIISTVIGATPPLPLQVSSRCSVTATIHSLGWYPTGPSAHFAISPQLRPSVTLCPRIAQPRWRMSTPWVHEEYLQRSNCFSGSCAPIVLLSLSVTLGFIVVITIIYFVDGVYGKGFPLDSTPCIYLILLFRPFCRSLISYFAHLVCGWCPTRESCVAGFFPGAGWISGDRVFSLP